MKIYYVSDTHVDYRFNSLGFDLDNPTLAQVEHWANEILMLNQIECSEDAILILAGDHCEVRFTRLWVATINYLLSKFKHVVYVAGNHEYYSKKPNQLTFLKVNKIIQDFHNLYPRFMFLNNRSITIDSVTIIGSTLWTDMRNGNPLIMNSIRNALNDFTGSILFEDNNRLTPEIIFQKNKNARQFLKHPLKNIFQDKNKTIIVTHHAPEFVSKINSDIDYAFYNYNLKIESFAAKYWIHGHTHIPSDYMAGDIRVLSNPVGYSLLECKYEPKYIEI